MPDKGLISLVGKSGSGKSTILNLLMGILKPTKGKIFYKNNCLEKLSNSQIKNYQNKEIGVVFQHFNLFDDLTCIENVIIPSLISGLNKQDALKKAKELFVKFHIESLIDQKYGTLSGGEKQRVAILRAIINNPNVILADEPTGALDSKNSVLIMDELKKLSRDKLVIVVTHNLALMKNYEDIRLIVKNNSVSKIEYKSFCISNIKKINKSNYKIINSFLLKHLKRNIIRNTIATCAIFFSSLSSFCAFGYIKGSDSSIEKYKKETLQYNYGSIAKKSIIEIPNSHIKISKLTRPNNDELEQFENIVPSIHFENNYQIIFSSLPTFLFNNEEINDIEFMPIYDFNLFNSLLKKGRFPLNDFSEVVVNQEFLERFNYKIDEIINSEIILSFASVVTNKVIGKANIKDEIVFSNHLKIVGVVNEFSYLNNPRIYYSYIGLDEYLNNIKLENYSKELGKNVSAKDLVSKAKNDNPHSGYSYHVFIDDINDVEKFFNLIKTEYKNNEFDLTSNAYTVSSSYQSMVSVTSSSLTIFIVILLIGALFIIIITSFFNFTNNKKESAILSILGSKKETIFFLYYLENLLVVLIGVILCLIICKPTELLLNYIINKLFNLSGLISIPLFSYVSLLFLLTTLIISFISTFIPLSFYENGYVIEELKDE